jgi:hypothetical protein
MSNEKENVFRALKEESLLITNPFLCRIGIHRWTKWSSPELKKSYYTTEIKQERYCVSCNIRSTGVGIKR